MDGGNDTLAIADDGYGSDSLHFAGDAPAKLAGNARRFETIALTAYAITVPGTLGAAVEPRRWATTHKR